MPPSADVTHEISINLPVKNYDMKLKGRKNIKKKIELLGERMDFLSCLSDRDLQDYKEAFQEFDKNGSGRISAKDLIFVLRSLGENPSETDFHDILLEMNIEKGKIDFLEFIHFMAGRKEQDSNVLKSAFEIFDMNGDGMISSQEFRRATSKYGDLISDAEVTEIISQADINQDGVIDYKEFVKMFEEEKRLNTLFVNISNI